MHGEVAILDDTFQSPAGVPVTVYCAIRHPGTSQSRCYMSYERLGHHYMLKGGATVEEMNWETVRNWAGSTQVNLTWWDLAFIKQLMGYHHGHERTVELD